MLSNWSGLAWVSCTTLFQWALGCFDEKRVITPCNDHNVLSYNDILYGQELPLPCSSSFQTLQHLAITDLTCFMILVHTCTFCSTGPTEMKIHVCLDSGHSPKDIRPLQVIHPLDNHSPDTHSWKSPPRHSPPDNHPPDNHPLLYQKYVLWYRGLGALPPTWGGGECPGGECLGLNVLEPFCLKDIGCL